MTIDLWWIDDGRAIPLGPFKSLDEALKHIVGNSSDPSAVMRAQALMGE